MLMYAEMRFSFDLDFCPLTPAGIPSLRPANVT